MNSCSPPTQPIDSTRLCARFSSTEPRQQRRPSGSATHPGVFRVLCHEFRKNPQREFFLPQTKKAKLPPPRERLRQKIITLRKQNSSVYDIRDALDQSGEKLSPGLDLDDSQPMSAIVTGYFAGLALVLKIANAQCFNEPVLEPGLLFIGMAVPGLGLLSLSLWKFAREELSSRDKKLGVLLLCSLGIALGAPVATLVRWCA